MESGQKSGSGDDRESRDAACRAADEEGAGQQVSPRLIFRLAMVGLIIALLLWKLEVFR